MIDRLIALSEYLESREVRHDVHPPPLPYMTVFTDGGTYVGLAEVRRDYYWRGQRYDDVERCALAIALDVANAEISGAPARSPRRSGRTPRAHHRRT